MSEEIILQEKMQAAQEKRAVVVVGRFQPPTVGHYKIINLAKKYIRENQHLLLFTRPVVVIVDGKQTSKNKKENPLTVEDRIYFMENSGKANGVEFLSAPNAFAAFAEVRKAGYEPIVIGAGSDRLNGYLDLLDEKFLDKNGKKQKHYSLAGLDTRHELKPNEESLEKIKSGKAIVSEISASLARKAVELDYFDEFVKIVGLEKNEAAAKKMFKIIKKGLENE